MPIEPITTENVDQDTDSPRLARVQLKQLVDVVNQMVSEVKIVFSVPSLVVPVDGGGALVYAGVTSTARVLRAGVDETSSWTFSKVDVGVTTTLVVNVFNVTNLASSSGYVEVTAARSGHTPLTQRLLVTRSNTTVPVGPVDTTPPPSPIGFTANPGINIIQLGWDPAVYSQGGGNDKTIIYGTIWNDPDPAPLFSSPSVKQIAFADATAITYTLPSDPGTRWCLWIKFKTLAGVLSIDPAPEPGTFPNGLVVTTAQDPSKLIGILDGWIDNSALAPALSSRIDLIDGPSGLSNSVNARLLAETNNRAAAIAAEVIARNNAIALETAARLADIDAIYGSVSRTFYSATAPVSTVDYTLKFNDTWYDTDDGNKRYSWNGSTWVEVVTLDLSQLTTDLSTEITNRVTGDSAEVGIRSSMYAGLKAATGTDYIVFNQEAQPTGVNVGDLWVWTTPTGVETFRRFTGTVWVDSVANKRAATFQGAYATAALPLTDLVIGDVARRTEDNVIVVWNGSSWVVKAMAPSPVLAFVEQERNARITENTAEAASRETLATQVRGAYTGSDLNSVTSGLIFTERVARSTADTTEVYARESLAAGFTASVGTDYRVFYQEAAPTATQIGDIWTWKTPAGVETFSRWNGTAWIDSSALKRSAAFYGVYASAPVLSNLVIGDVVRLQPPDNTVLVWNGAAWVTKGASTSTNWALIDQEKEARVTADTAEALARTNLSTQIRGGYTGTDIDALSSGLIFSERSARVTADTAEANNRESLYAGVKGTVGTNYTIFNQATAPVATQIGDIWTWKTPLGVETFSRWSGTAWVDSLSDKRAAQYKGAFANAGALPATGNVIGDTSRQSDTNEVKVWNGTAWIVKVSDTSASWAFIDQEQSARVTAISSEATARNSLSTQLRGSYTGTDINFLTSGLIYDERQARATADASAISRIQALEAGAQNLQTVLAELWEGTDPLSKWQVVSGTGEASILSVVDGQSGKVLRVGNNAGNDALTLVYLNTLPLLSDSLYKITAKVRRLGGTGVFKAGVAGVKADGVTLVDTAGLPTYTNAFFGTMSGGLAPNITETTYSSYFKKGTAFGGVGTKLDPMIFHQDVRYLRPMLVLNSPNSTGIMEVLSLQVEILSADVSASETTITQLDSKVNDPLVGNLALATKVTSLEASVYTPTTINNPTHALIVGQYSTTASMNSAIASSFNTVSARLNSGGDVSNALVAVETKASAKNANFVQATAPVSTAGYTLKLNDIWIDTSAGRATKRWNGTAWEAADDIRIGQSASQITTLQSTVNASGQFETLFAWEFRGSTQSWTGVGVTLATSTENLIYTSTSTTPIIRIGTLAIEGARYDKIRMRIKRTAGTGWLGTLFYTTAGHSESGSYYQNNPANPALNTWVVVEWDMETMPVNPADWVGSTITGLRFDLGNTATDAFQIDWIAVGRRGVSASYSAVQQEISTRASETGHLSAQYSVRVQLTQDGKDVIGGFGIMGTSGGTAGPTVDFGIMADKFWVGAPVGSTGITSVKPFIIQTSDAVDPGTGLTVPKGVYMDSAYITNLTALWAKFGNVVTTSIQAASISASQLTLGSGIIGGNLRSSNYSAGISGWQLQPNGTAQLPAAAILGTLTAAQINANGLSIRDTLGNIILNASTSKFTGDVTGTLNGAPAATVVAGAAAASAAVDPNVLTPPQKALLKASWIEIVNEHSYLATTGNSFGLTGRVTDYNAKYTALSNYLATLTTPVQWDDTSGNTNYSQVTLVNLLGDYYTYKSWLMIDMNDFTKYSLSTKLDAAARNVLTGSGGFAAGNLNWDSLGNRTTGYGVGFTQKGIAAYNSSGNPTFILDGTTGSATFSGTLSAAAGTFAGVLTASEVVTTGNLQAYSVTQEWVGEQFSPVTFGASSTNIVSFFTVQPAGASWTGQAVFIGEITTEPYASPHGMSVELWAYYNGDWGLRRSSLHMWPANPGTIMYATVAISAPWDPSNPATGWLVRCTGISGVNQSARGMLSARVFKR